MPIELLNKSKLEAIGLIQLCLERLAFAKLDQASIAGTYQHLSAMRLDKRPMNVLCEFATNPITGKTVLTITSTFGTLQ